MTVRINFLPKTYQPPKQLGAKEWAVAAGAAVAVVGTSVFYMGTFSDTARMERMIVVEQAQLQGAKAELAEAAQLKIREDKVVQAESELNALGGRNWSRVLLNLTDLTPQQVTWASVSVKGDELTLVGTSAGLVDVAQLFGGLLDNPEIAHVALRYINEEGLPITIAAATDDQLGQAVARQTLVTFRQMEFEIVITLSASEGGRRQYGT